MRIPYLSVSQVPDTANEGLFEMHDVDGRIVKALANVSWLNACGDEVLLHLAACATFERVSDGTTVSWRGRQMTHFLILVRGTLELSITSIQGKRHVINRQEPGQVFGLIPVLEDSTAIHDAVARGACEIVRIPQAALRMAMREHLVLNDQVIHVLCARARKSYQSLADQTLSPLPVRIMRLLLSQSISVDLKTLVITQADLADMLGITRQSLNIELKRLERQSLITLGRGRIDIEDHAQMMLMVDAAD